MAHTLNIPIRFRFIRVPVVWDIRSVKAQRNHKERQLAFPKLLEEGKPAELNGWSCRDEFFKIPIGDDTKLLNFLTNVGVFSNLEILGHWSDEVAEHCRSGHPVPIDLRGLWKFREGLRHSLMNREAFKRDSADMDFPLSFELGSVASGLVTTTDAYHMLLATVFADVTRGIRFKTCKREDCQTPFPLTSKHVKTFCSQYCGHLVSQRKIRAAKQRKRRNAKTREVSAGHALKTR